MRARLRQILKNCAAALLLMSACGQAQNGATIIPALERLAAQGNAEAIYHLGMAYQTGTGAPKSPQKAFAAFQRAAALGDVLASYKLGCFYAGQEGDDFEADPQLALRHKLVAAKAGYALAQQDVAALYASQGQIREALDWLKQSVDQGWSDALATYASVHNGAEGIKPDPVKTAAYFRLFINREDGSDKQRAWLTDFESKLSPAQKAEVAGIVSSYRAVPTALTIKALSGQKAAVALLARHD